MLVSGFNPNRSLDPYSTTRGWKDNFLTSFIFLLASCFSFLLSVSRYAFELTANHLLNNLMKSVQNLMTDLGSSYNYVIKREIDLPSPHARAYARIARSFMFLSVTSVTALCKMLFFNWICAKMMEFNKKLLSREFYCSVWQQIRGVLFSYSLLFLSVTFVFELRCVTAVTAKKQNLWGIYACAWQGRARSKPDYRAAQHKGARALAFFILELVFAKWNYHFG